MSTLCRHKNQDKNFSKTIRPREGKGEKISIKGNEREGEIYMYIYRERKR